MTREQRLRHIKEGKTILRARRQPKSRKWEIVTYTGSTFMVYSFDKFDTRKECEDFITEKIEQNPGKFISDFSLESELTYQKLKLDREQLIHTAEKLIDRLEWIDSFIHNEASNRHNQESINEARELIKSMTGVEAETE
jgi:hypothetical protein